MLRVKYAQAFLYQSLCHMGFLPVKFVIRRVQEGLNAIILCNQNTVEQIKFNIVNLKKNQ